MSIEDKATVMASPPSSASSPSPQTVIAVCGCGHDGRLGVGCNAPSTLHEIVLLEPFLRTSSEGAAPAGDILQLACGAYHTLLLTTTGLFGWGLHEEGQLGLGRPSTARSAEAAGGTPGIEVEDTTTGVPAHLDQPSRIPLADLVGEDTATILSIHCGAHHSVVRTTTGVFVTGRKDCGQLGLGHTEDVYQWTRLCSYEVMNMTGNLAAAASPIVTMPTAHNPDGSGKGMRLVQGTLTHISCGSHHTLFAWADAVALCATSSTATVHHSGSTRESAGAFGAEDPTVLYYPTVLFACGRGDFGELGYDGDAWAVQQAKTQRQERALRAELHLRQQCGGMDLASSRDATQGDGAGGYKFRWKAAAAVKPRRPPFNASYMEKVEIPELEADAVPLPTCYTDILCASLHHLGCFARRCDDVAETPSELHASEKAVALSSLPWRGHTATGGEKDSAAFWEVVSLQAMHHHSAVTLQRRTKKNETEVIITDTGAAPVQRPSSPPAPLWRNALSQQLVLHWGCYYCSEIEDAAASHPRDVFHDLHEKGWRGSGGLHAADEVMFRFYDCDTDLLFDEVVRSSGSAAVAPPLQVLGSGNLGLGTEESFSRTWTDLPYAFVDPTGETRQQTRPLPVRSVVGRTHFLLLAQEPPLRDACINSAAEVPAAVYGFGENLHGQLGAPAYRYGKGPQSIRQHPAEVVGDDIVSIPRVVLQVGDLLRSAAMVRHTVREASISADRSHSSAKEVVAGSDGGAQPPATHFKVVAIRDVGAGARHSTFLVDVLPVLCGC